MIKYQLQNGKCLIVLDNVIEFLKGTQPTITNIECGGILLGKFSISNNNYLLSKIAKIDNVSKKMGEYDRDINKANNYITMNWKLSKGEVNYLGEWHSHNQTIPRPSSTDIKTMNNIISRVDSWNERFLFIIGKSQLYIGVIYKGNNRLKRLGEIKL